MANQTLTKREAKIWLGPDGQQCLPFDRPKRQWPWLPITLLVLAGYLLYCHGCHRDVDNELIVLALRRWRLVKK
jgi:hypothetical protein